MGPIPKKWEFFAVYQGMRSKGESCSGPRHWENSGKVDFISKNLVILLAIT